MKLSGIAKVPFFERQRWVLVRKRFGLLAPTNCWTVDDDCEPWVGVLALLSVGVGGSPLLQPMEQKMRPRRGRNGRPSSELRQVWQQKQPSVACQCCPSWVICPVTTNITINKRCSSNTLSIDMRSVIGLFFPYYFGHKWFWNGELLTLVNPDGFSTGVAVLWEYRVKAMQAVGTRLSHDVSLTAKYSVALEASKMAHVPSPAFSLSAFICKDELIASSTARL